MVPLLISFVSFIIQKLLHKSSSLHVCSSIPLLGSAILSCVRIQVPKLALCSSTMLSLCSTVFLSRALIDGIMRKDVAFFFFTIAKEELEYGEMVFEVDLFRYVFFALFSFSRMFSVD